MVSISEKLNLKPQLSGADIKSLYEAEADTYAYTEAEKTSVSTALQPAALNNTALTGIPIAPTAAEGTNTTQIATTAFVLANSGIDNGIVINGVANFWQSTPPTQRVDGSALQDNDIWYDSTTGRSWFRKGVYWTGEARFVSAPLTPNNGSLNSLVTSTNLLLNSNSILYFEDFTFYIDGNGAFNFIDANNYYTIGVKAKWNTTGPTTLLTFETNDMTGTKSIKTIIQNTAVAFSGFFYRVPVIFVQIDAITGSPGVNSQFFGFNYKYREVYV